MSRDTEPNGFEGPFRNRLGRLRLQYYGRTVLENLVRTLPEHVVLLRQVMMSCHIVASLSQRIMHSKHSEAHQTRCASNNAYKCRHQQRSCRCEQGRWEQRACENECNKGRADGAIDLFRINC
eukprot:6173606-Pleurochrysis_carterae.AAC.2